MTEGAEPGRIGSRPVHRGRIVDLRLDTVRFPDGSVGELEMIHHSGAAAILPILGDPADPDPDIVLIHQYRYAAGGYLYEVPAGRPDRAGEDWEVCARRELEEETGLVAGRIERLTSVLTTPGFTDECIQLFTAHDLRQGSSAPDDDEFIELVQLPLSCAVEMVRTEEITDAKTICTLLFVSSFRPTP